MPHTHTTASDRPSKQSQEGTGRLVSFLRPLRLLVWKEGAPLASQFRLAWALYLLLIVFVLILNRATT